LFGAAQWRCSTVVHAYEGKLKGLRFKLLKSGFGKLIPINSKNDGLDAFEKD
jgi:hypothetical protein